MRMRCSKTIAVAVLVVCASIGAAAPLINGAGATFPYPIYSKWFDEYNKKTGVKINYQSIGSGGGIRQVLEGTVDFGATDGPMSVGKSTAVSWPVGLGGKGNEGVTGLVEQTPNAIGYVELVYAVQNKLPYAEIKNRGGSFVTPTLESVTAAAAGAAAKMPED